MEILILGLILVGLMVYASTRIKKRAAEAFEPELIETARYSLRKPEGFLHVIDSPDHDLEAYSREFDEGDFRLRRAKIEVDVFPQYDLDSVVEAIEQAASRSEPRSSSNTVSVLETEEEANEIRLSAVYKFVRSGEDIYRLRFGVLAKHRAEYSDRINDTIDSFTVKTI